MTIVFAILSVFFAVSHAIDLHASHSAQDSTPSDQASSSNSVNNASADYNVMMKSGDKVSTYKVHVMILYSNRDKKDIVVNSSMSNLSGTQNLVGTYRLSEFESISNVTNYANTMAIPDASGVGSIMTVMKGVARNNMVLELEMSTKNTAASSSWDLSINVLDKSGFSHFFSQMDHNSSLAYLLIPQLLPPNLELGGITSQYPSTSSATSDTQPLIFPGGGGDGGGDVWYSSAGTLHTYDCSFYPNYHLWDITATLDVEWTGNGGTYITASSGESHTIDRSDWWYVTSSSDNSRNTNSYTYTASFQLDANFPFDGLYQWEDFSSIQVIVYNDGSSHVEITNVLYYWDVFYWAPWKACNVFDSNLAPGQSADVTQYILIPGGC